jgi:Protein of unknown function (DUF3106)
MKRGMQFGIALCGMIALALISAPGAVAQRGGARVPPRAAPAPQAKAPTASDDNKSTKSDDANSGSGAAKSADSSGADGKGGNGRNLMGLPSTWVERLQDMTPAEQEKFLANNERFKGMTPQQQAQIRARLQYWNNLSPDQRQELRERERVWERMTPEQRQYVHDTLLPKWQSMPPASKLIIRRHLARLSGLNENQRQEMLNRRSFMKNMTPEEQSMLKELSRLRVGDTPDAPPAPNGM